MAAVDTNPIKHGRYIMEKEKKIDYHEFDFGEGIDNLSSCSTTDCTGIMYRTPKNEEERESYQEVYDYVPPFVREKD